MPAAAVIITNSCCGHGTLGGLGIGVNDRIGQNFQDVWGPLRGQHVVLCQDQEFRSVFVSVHIKTCLLFHECTTTNVPLPRKAAANQPFKEPTVIHQARQTTTPPCTPPPAPAHPLIQRTSFWRPPTLPHNYFLTGASHF